MDVRTVVLGGGISMPMIILLMSVIKPLKKEVLTHQKNFRVLRSKINNNAGVLGAAALIFE
jgi:predicted NBD/HSP70 family sugar kinase